MLAERFDVLVNEYCTFRDMTVNQVNEMVAKINEIVTHLEGKEKEKGVVLAQSAVQGNRAARRASRKRS